MFKNRLLLLLVAIKRNFNPRTPFQVLSRISKVIRGNEAFHSIAILSNLFNTVDHVFICLLFSHKQKKYLSHVVDNIIFGISVPDYPRISVEITFLGKIIMCLLFSRKQQHRLITCCWQYHIRNQRPPINPG